jgi:hypothetical protein
MVKGTMEMEDNGNTANYALIKKSYFIATFIVMIMSVCISVGVYAYSVTKVKDTLENHEMRLNKVETAILERTQFEAEIIINLKILMEKNGLKYQTVK